MRRLFLTLIAIVLVGFVAGPSVWAGEPKTPLGEYAERRAKLVEAVGAPVVLFGYEVRDVRLLHPFHQQWDFFYLTGHLEPRAALLINPMNEKTDKAGLPREVLFLPKKNRRSVVYDGLSRFAGEPGMEELTGFRVIRPIEELPEVLKQVREFYPDLDTLLPSRRPAEVDSLHAARWQAALEGAFPGIKLRDVRGVIADMRQVKSKSELAWLQRANDIAGEGHRAAMRAVRPGMMEYELAAVMEYEFRRANCNIGYGSIVGSGPNSIILHYNAARREMRDGEVVLLDVGAACGGYTTDITRTIPVNGKFTDRQRQIYEIVLGAQQAAIDAVKPGMTSGGRGEKSLRWIAEEYIRKKGEEIGEDLTQYLLHGVAHDVGLSVHDTPSMAGRPFRPGMVITVEPGIYIPQENLGVRIEDVVLVTETGYKLLSASIPRSVEDVEAVMTDREVATYPGHGQPCIRAIDWPRFAYPPIARQARILGTVELDLEIGSDGQLKRLLSSKGHGLLVPHTVKMLSTIEFSCFKEGTLFPIWHKLIFEFGDVVEGGTNDGADSRVVFVAPDRIRVLGYPVPVQTSDSHTIRD